MLRARYLIAGFAVACLAAPNPQAPGQANGPVPAPVKKTYSLGDNHRLEYTIKWNDTGRDELLTNDFAVCRSFCMGKVHFAHTACDTSCDYSCKELHEIVMVPYWSVGDTKGQFVHNSMDAMSAGAQAFGAQASAPSLSHTVFNDVQEAMTDAKSGDSKFSQSVTYAHFNDKPCAGIWRTMKGRAYDVSVEWKVYRVTEVEGRIVETQGPSGTSLYSTVLMPGKTYEDKPYEHCECVLLKEDTETGFLPDRPMTGGGTSTGTEYANTGVRLGEMGAGPLLGDQNLQTIGFAVNAESMVAGQVSAMNPFKSPFTINIAPGTLLDTNDDGVQDMMVMAGVQMSVPPAGLSPGDSSELATAKLRLACLEMNKREPTPATKYRVLPTRDPVLSRLAAITDKSRMRGPWDQARVWIYTDAASYEDIKKKMIPSPGMATYVRVMSEAAGAGVPVGQKRYDKCFSPSLLSALDASPSQLSFFASETVRRDPAGVLAWAKGESARYATALVPTADKGHFESAARLISTLCRSSAPQAGLLLLKGVPEGSRAALMAHDLSPAWALCWSSDGAVARDAQALVEAYGPASKGFYLANVRK